MKKQLLMSTLAAVMAGTAVPAFAADGVSASAGAATTYMFRGLDLSGSSAQVFGDLKYSMAGAYAGVWVSGGGVSESDLYAGYALTAGPVGLDVGVVNYNYDGGDSDTTFDATEAYVKASFMGVTASYYDAIAVQDSTPLTVAGNGGNDTAALSGEYFSLGYSMDKFTGLVGYADVEDTAVTGLSNYTHVDLTYAYNSNFSLMLSKIVDEEIEESYDDSVKVVVSVVLPIM